MDIKEIYESYKDYIDKEVEVEGWIKKHRKQKEIGFIDLSDGTCFKILQIVYDRDCPLDYPLQPKDHSLEFFREQAYLRPRVTLFQAVFRVRSMLAMAIHEYFQSRGYLYLHAPIFTASDCEGAGEMFQVTTLDLEKVAQTGKVSYDEEFFGKPVGLSVSTQFEAETFAQAFKKVYTFGPTFRADKSHTPYHVAEFWQIEPEVAFCDLEGIMDIAEELVKFVIKYTLKHAKDEMDYLDKQSNGTLLDKLTNVLTSTFKRVPYKDCIEILKKSQKEFEFKPDYGSDISKEHEKYLAEYFKCPFFITMWPKESSMPILHPRSHSYWVVPRAAPL